MGTRADFYIGRGKSAEWLGSIAWDGHPDGIERAVLLATDKRTFRTAVGHFLARRDDATTPEMGWPWPWDDSGTTDFAYAFDGGMVWASSFGTAWFDPKEPLPERIEDDAKVATFPDMKARKKVTFGKRSGVFVIRQG